MEELEYNFLKENKLIFKKYKPIKKIGSGSFGIIYSVIRLTDKKTFAMKTEKISEKTQFLESESYNLFRLQGGLGIPKLITCGHIKNYNILIETLLDKSLYYIFITRNKESNLIDICLIGIQLLERLKWIHSKDLVYIDIKPSNFLIGINDPNVIYIVDFGLCKKYRSSKTGKHILPKLTKKFKGTIKYASPNAIKGKEISRRDDLISLGYMLIFLLKKKLPWENTFKNRSKYLELMHLKDTNGAGKLFYNIPKEFKEYIKYTRNLKFEQDPDYSYLSSLFLKIIINMDLDYKKIAFSWIDEKDRKKLLGVPRSLSKRKLNSHIRLYKSIEKESNDRLKRNLTNENKNLIIDFNLYKTHTLQNDGIISNNNSGKIDSFLKKINKNNIMKTTKSEKIIIKKKEIEKFLYSDKISSKNIKKKPKIKYIKIPNSNKNKISINPEHNSVSNNKNIFNNYEIKNLKYFNTIKNTPKSIQILEMNKMNNFHLQAKENYDNYINNNIKKFTNIKNKNSLKLFSISDNIGELLHLSNNIKYKSFFSKNNKSNNKLNINYSTNNFQNLQRYNMDISQ